MSNDYQTDKQRRLSENNKESIHDIINNNTKLEQIDTKLSIIESSLCDKLVCLKTQIVNDLQDYDNNKNTNNQVKAIRHFGVTCEGCNKTDFHGKRYQCLLCSNYNLCEKCEAKTDHPHNMIRFIDRDLEKKGNTLTRLNRLLNFNNYTDQQEVKERVLRVITREAYDNLFYVALAKRYTETPLQDFIDQMSTLFG